MNVVVDFGPIHGNAYTLAAALEALVWGLIISTNIRRTIIGITEKDSGMLFFHHDLIGLLSRIQWYANLCYIMYTSVVEAAFRTALSVD